MDLTFVVVGLIILLILAAILKVSLAFGEAIVRQTHDSVAERNAQKTLQSIQSLAGDAEITRLIAHARDDGPQTPKAMEKIRAVAARSDVAQPVFEVAFQSRDPELSDIGLRGLQIVNPSRLACLLISMSPANKATREYCRRNILALAPSLPIDGNGGLLDIFNQVVLNARLRYPWAYTFREQLDALESLVTSAIKREADLRAIGLSTDELLVQCDQYASTLSASDLIPARHAGEDFRSTLIRLRATRTAFHEATEERHRMQEDERFRREQKAKEQEWRRHQQQAQEQEQRRREQEARRREQRRRDKARPRPDRDHKDYYRVLQVDPAAEPKVIQAAYRGLAAKYHPDRYKGPGATARMQQINEAYDVLSDPAKRRDYDRSRDQR
jgi:hypothetical protein